MKGEPNATTPEFTNKNILDVQHWFQNVLPNRKYNYKTGMNTERGTLVLFQYQAHIIASAILDDKVMYEKPLEGGYTGYYSFVPSSIATFQPLEASDMKGIWHNFYGFTNSQQKLDTSGYQELMLLLLRKNITFAFHNESEEMFQEGVDEIYLKKSTITINDTPRDPLKVTSSGNKQQWARSRVTAKKAIMLADYTCEFDVSHTYFTSKTTGRNYVEAHHLIPMEFQDEFEKSLDVEANIVSLCPVCHKIVHHATFEEKKEILERLYEKRKERLKKSGIEFELGEVLSFYG